MKWLALAMATDRRTLLERLSWASAILRDVDTPDDLRALAKRVRDQADVLLGLQDALARREAKAKAAAEKDPPQPE
jgi:hypothetical protein